MGDDGRTNFGRGLDRINPFGDGDDGKSNFSRGLDRLPGFAKEKANDAGDWVIDRLASQLGPF